ncbi:MAG: putative LPS assembly protein LptD [Gemmatimonadota bacterium]
MRLPAPALAALVVVSFAARPGELKAQEPAAPSAAAVRADSLRNVVLDRLRGRREVGAPVEGDSVPPDSAAVEPGADPTVPAVVVVQPRIPAELPLGADSIMEALLRVEGFSSASYSGDRADFSAPSRRLVLQGTEERRATFSGDGNRLEADSSITYDDTVERIRTAGRTDFVPAVGAPVQSAVLIYDVAANRGTARDARTTYDEGARWIVQGDLDSVESGLLFASSARFTSCDLANPHSYFEASELKMVSNSILVAWPVRMYIEDVPVLWLPFIFQNLERGRSSGLLTPVFSMNDIVRTSSGYNRRLSNLGFYWSMSDYSDVTLALDWYSNNYTAVQTGMNYAWNRHFLTGSLNVKHYWGVSGRRELGLNTSNDWRPTERTNVRGGASFISSSEFLLQNSLDPREINQTVDSDVSVSRRFDFGNLTLGASRRQYLNEDRTELTLPSGSFSLSTLTLLGAPPQTARWYNNIGVTGSTSWSQRKVERGLDPEAEFSFSQTSNVRTQGSARGSMRVGDLSLSGSLQASEIVFGNVPGEFFPAGSESFGEFRSADLNWSASLSYLQRLIGSTTLTPNLSLDGQMLRVDSIAEATRFVEAPLRTRIGVTLQSDFYGFYPGFGPFETLRHKITPAITWSYSPEVEPTELQERVFGGGFARVQNVYGVSINQTWEAKAREGTDVAPVAGVAGLPIVADTTAGDAPPGAEVEAGLLVAEELEVIQGDAPLPQTGDDGGPGRLPPSRVVTLLALNTSALSYDKIVADSTGRFLDGFTTTTLSNTISSDYLRGLSLSFSHSLFDDFQRAEEGGARRFDPHLSQVSLGFGLNERSGLVTLLRRLLRIPATLPPEAEAPLPEEPEEAPGERAGFDANRVIPGGVGEMDERPRREGWDATLQYSLQRPRPTAVGAGDRFQTLSAQISFAPSENWTVDWRTSYDVEERRFNDHVVRLTRDLHEWEANFSFRQTITGNWSFQFEVALRANQDLRFDFEQRSLEGQGSGL